jgi:glycosyltransferase involved in cell wall biosynthesis
LCDVGVVPYDDNPLWTYPQPTKFFEYCASGLPVVATVDENSDLAMLIRRHNVGYAVKPLNLSEFISAVRKLYKLDENERKEIGARARNLVEDSFDKAKIAERLAEALKELCND